jgi:hypothetical protein
LENFPQIRNANERRRALRASSALVERVVARYDFRAAAFPPLRPAAFFCAVVPPCDELLRELEECELLPPRLDAPDEFEIRAARSFDIPLSFRASYCFSFLTLGRLLGMTPPCAESPCEQRFPPLWL